MKLLGTILIALSTITGCKKQAINTVIPDKATTPATATVFKLPTDTITYLALGDSYTIGESVPEVQSYPFQLMAQLKANKLRAGKPEIIARTGWTTAQLKEAIAAAGIHNKYSFVTLLIGVNNQYQNFDPEAYRKDFDELVNTAISFAIGGNKQVLVLSIPDYSVTPFAKGRDTNLISSQLSQYNAINEGESSRLGVHYLNITGISREAATDLSLLANDGLHPQEKCIPYG